MTAEIAILNKNAVALAADSAVTIGQGNKIYNSAIKVFSLSKYEPVGVMVYGNAGLLDVPWETIIKTYRKKLSNKQFDTLEEYAADFLGYLPKSSGFFPSEIQEIHIQRNIQGLFSSLRKQLEEEVQRTIRKSGGITEPETLKILDEVITSQHQHIGNQKRLESRSQQWETALKKRLSNVATRCIKSVFQKLSIKKEQETALIDMATWVHTREIFSGFQSGVVVCGYGASDIFPSITTYVIDGVYEDRLKAARDESKSFKISHQNSSVIIPFAQEDMVATFVEGVNPSIERFVKTWLTDIFSRLPDAFSETDLAGSKKEQRDFKRRFQSNLSKVMQEFETQFKQHKWSYHVEPIVSMVDVLPKDELAEMAESLVNLTAFKRRMTDELETVGGPIDVAVISKGDGLIWVKRKHYFKAEYNQHFFQNYFREMLT